MLGTSVSRTMFRLSAIVSLIAGTVSCGRPSAPPAPAVVTHNPKIPVELSYPIISEYPGSDPQGRMASKRTIEIQLNMRVSEDVLKEIALEMKAKEDRQFEYTRLFFYLPQFTSLGYRPKNAPWARADFDEGLKVVIMGLTVEGERECRTKPIGLPLNAKSLGTWINEQRPLFPGSPETDRRFTIYEQGDHYFYLTRGPVHEMRLLLKNEDISFGLGSSTDIYIIHPNGDFELRNGQAELVYTLYPIDPPLR